MGSFLMRLASFSIQRTLIFGAILGGIYYMTIYDNGASLTASIAKVDQEIVVQEAKEKEADEALKEVERVRTRVGALSDQFKTVSQALPSEIQMSDIIRVVDMVSRASGVSIKTKEPRPVVNHDFYEEIPLRITLEGSYSEITLFLYYLASTERIMKANNFSISAPSSQDRLSVGRLVFEGQVVSYRFLGIQNAEKGKEEQKK